MKIRTMLIAAAFFGGLMLLQPGSAAAAKGTITLKTGAVTVDPDGYVECTVVARSPAPINATVLILSTDGTGVNDFGSSWIISPLASDDGRYFREEMSGSLNDTVTDCTATVTSDKRKDLVIEEMSLKSFDANGQLIDVAAGK